MAITKLEMLVIRACKSSNPRKRLESVYRRFYYHEVQTSAILSIVLDVIDKYFPTLPSRAIMYTKPDWYDKSLSWEERTLNGCVFRIRMEQVDKILPNEFIWPAWYRNFK
jgi:hypothetical protein